MRCFGLSPVAIATVLLPSVPRSAAYSLQGGRRLFLSTATATLMTTTTSAGFATAKDGSPKQNIRWGIVGLGDVTEKKSGPPFFKCRGSSLVAVMRRTPGKAAAWAQRVVPGGDCVGYDDLDAFLQHEGLDAVYIASPPGAHLDLCRRVAQAGKAVYVEKPVGRCAAETQAMIQCMKQASNLPFYTAYISRAYERTQTVRQLLKEGYIGDRVLSIDYRFCGNIVPRTDALLSGGASNLPWRLVASQAGGGEVMDIGCHIVDRIDYLCGPLLNVRGEAQNRNSPHQAVEDHVTLEAQIGASPWAALPSEGAQVSCLWDFTGMNNESVDELIIAGPKGYLKMVGMTPSLPVSVYSKDNDQLVKRVEFEAPEHTGQPLIQAVTDDLRGMSNVDPFLLSRGDNALRASRVLDQVLDSYYGGREIGFWDRPESWPGRRRQST